MRGQYDLLMRRLSSLVDGSSAPWTMDACGVTRRDTPIASVVHRDAYAADSGRSRVLLLSGLSGSAPETDTVVSTLEAYSRSQRVKNRIALSAIPCANPDGLILGCGPDNGAGGDPSVGYPPEDGFFDHETDPEARYLWRYVGFMAPDLVVEVRVGETVGWEHTDGTAALPGVLDSTPINPDGGLVSALAQGVPNDLGQVPGLRLTAPADRVEGEIGRLWSAIERNTSPAREELGRRRGRTPLDVAATLVTRYGDTLEPVIYTQGVALSGRLRYGALTGTRDEFAAGIADLVEPYLSGAKSWFGDDGGAGASHAGLVWCAEMYDATGDDRFRDLLIATADLYRGNEAGAPPPPCDPDYRTEDFFFSGALMGRAYALSGDVTYLDTQTSFLLNASIQQDDGLFRHCRSVPYYWGRGNGFAALGYAETLTYLPEDHWDRAELIEMHARHLNALRGLQRQSGMLAQLLDFGGSYQELTATCMTGYAVSRGLRLGWLDNSYRPFADSLWWAASERIGLDGGVVDGCTGTGAVDGRRFYLDREAEFGQDDRTGNLALWFAIEMERLIRATP